MHAIFKNDTEHHFGQQQTSENAVCVGSSLKQRWGQKSVHQSEMLQFLF